MKLTATLEGLDVEVGFVGLPRPPGRQGAEILMAVASRALRELAGCDIRPIRAAFAHARNADMPEFSALLRRQVAPQPLEAEFQAQPAVSEKAKAVERATRETISPTPPPPNDDARPGDAY